ncbi:uncharacterized protein RSE6_13977 [Rhynchosporium secalis]|uniref:Uncharacterized protein n=1 Tax=Rhynchosporium secalis TaxID=38038 RepID=A0A1E1MUX2_RHYSE|nr:uncharacterized protein RSE6_13977 [Rhynchosporium secalis]
MTVDKEDNFASVEFRVSCCEMRASQEHLVRRDWQVGSLVWPNPDSSEEACIALHYNTLHYLTLQYTALQMEMMRCLLADDAAADHTRPGMGAAYKYGIWRSDGHFEGANSGTPSKQAGSQTYLGNQQLLNSISNSRGGRASSQPCMADEDISDNDGDCDSIYQDSTRGFISVYHTCHWPLMPGDALRTAETSGPCSFVRGLFGGCADLTVCRSVGVFWLEETTRQSQGCCASSMGETIMRLNMKARSA